eukprot:TRINITY_DN16060_c0_g1_i1.p1 TRINITY_DN16060_c0_g1~~TRINITY_DN16060_c0_g1_i1.p1  ORF type:complete len:240 (-),score=63.17 TRINITY_DN16060_c0_g1_i1:107-784(-)
MERKDRIAAQRGFASLLRLLRQWEAADKIAEHELKQILDGLTRLDYVSPAHAGLLGKTAMHAEVLALARATLQRRTAESAGRLAEMQAEMAGFVAFLDALLKDITGASEEQASLVISGKALPGSLAGARGAVRAAADMLREEVGLRASLLEALSQLSAGEATSAEVEKERRRLLLIWQERPYSTLEEGGQLSKLTKGRDAASIRLGSLADVRPAASLTQWLSNIG